MKKSDIDQYRDRFDRESLPSINVKVHDAWKWDQRARTVASLEGASVTEQDAFAEWCAEHHDDEDLSWLFDAACQSGWENAETDAEEVFGINVKVEARGRSGGHLVVLGLPDVDEWDAIAVSRWARFSRYCQANVDNVAHEMAWLAYMNVWVPMRDEQDAEAAEDAAALLPIVSVA